MKHMKIIAIVLAVLSCSAANAKAQEPRFNIDSHELQAPDISAKLNSVVQAKMDQLIKATYMYKGYTRIVELGTEGEVIPTALNKKIPYDVEKKRS